MDSYDIDSLNPWELECITLKNLKEALKIGEVTGHYDPRTESNRDKLLYDEMFQSSPSMLLTSLLKSVSKRKDDLRKTDKDIHLRMLDKETADFSHHKELEKKLNLVKDVSDHLQSTNSDEITRRLQQPFLNESLKLEASYHRYASQLLPLTAEIISDLHILLDNTDWIQHKNIRGPELEALLSDLTSTLADLQSTVHSLCRVREVVNQKKTIA